MDFSPQQATAASAVAEWIAQDRTSDNQIYRLFGFAGTGKTTIAKSLAEGVEGTVKFMTFTGKAALVLRQKGCLDATTIHSQIYTPKIKSMAHLAELQHTLKDTVDPKFRAEIESDIAREKANLRRPAFNLNLESNLNSASLIVLDEVSMVGNQVATDLLTFNVPILALGDPAQLPPVADGGYFTNAKPDSMLTEIHRQAEDSPIIMLATQVRQGRRLSFGQYGESSVVPRGSLSIQELASFDQIIVGRNNTRNVINARIRKEVRGFTEHLPVAGDMLVCLKNDKESGLLNGGQWEVQSTEVLDEDKILLTIRAPGDSENNYAFQVQAWRHYFEGREKDIAPYSMMEAQHFDFGYALTCHKSQGSAWDKVVIVDESACFRNDANKWLYTAITRAAKVVKVIQ